MDVGVVSPETVNAIMEKQKPADGPSPVDVYIQYRFAMSLQTAFQMHQKLTQLIGQAAGQQRFTPPEQG
jgi:hypothetical protein